MNIDEFNQRVEASYKRLSMLSSEVEVTPSLESTLVSKILRELHAAIDELQTAQEELSQQNDNLLTSYALLEVERQRYRDLFEQAPDGYLVTDLRGIIREANQAVSTLLQIEPVFLSGKPLITYIQASDRQTFFKQLAQLIDTTQHQIWETCLTTRGSNPVPVELHVSPVQDIAGQVTALRWIIRDISERKALAQEKELRKFKSQFMSVLSHEIRNPLSTIMSSAMLLECGFGSSNSLSNLQLELVGNIQSTVNNITQLLDEILSIEQTEAKRSNTQVNCFYLSDLCRNLVNEFRLIDSENHIIDLQIHTNAEQLSLSSSITPNLLRSILGNLLSNALKYSPPGSIVTFILTCQNGQATFIIQDQGIGISPKDQSNLFEPFYRATNVGDVPGTGLGLFITKHFLELNGGQIAIASEVGKGTLATVTLPLS